MEREKNIAVIGTGIAGMACAYHLRGRHKLTVYEKNNYVGGHTNTVLVAEGEKEIPIDTGFMVYNTQTYPNLVKFFEELGVVSKPTDMSFGINNRQTNFAARFTSLNTFFAQRLSLFKPSRWKTLFGIRRFFEEANEFLKESTQGDLTPLREYLAAKKPDPIVVENLILPMAAAVWSTPTEKMLDTPAYSLFSFLKNHGMLGIGEQFEWLTLVGGSRQYRDKIQAAIAPFTTTSLGATSVRRMPQGGVAVSDSKGGTKEFDSVIIATHADQALALLETPSIAEEALLSKFQYNRNAAVLHTDASVMPRERKAWASWNYRYDNTAAGCKGSTHYWMNSLQGVSDKIDYFVSIDYENDLDEKQIKWSTTYEHPRFDAAAISAQSELPLLNEKGPIYFCGSYFRHGFHEDAYTAALAVCDKLAKAEERELVG